MNRPTDRVKTIESYEWKKDCKPRKKKERKEGRQKIHVFFKKKRDRKKKESQKEKGKKQLLFERCLVLFSFQTSWPAV